MRLLLAIIVGLILAMQGSASSYAEKRIALVIGNSAYKDSPLTNPGNDARLMAETLEKVGFEVTTLLDGDHRAMKLAMVRFGRMLRASETVGLFYYAGHGVQSRGENYLIPVDAEIIDESEIDVFAVNVNDYLRTMERSSSRINIVVLDACRNNPFARSFRSQSRGLARVDAPRGTYIAYATAPGQVALDGEGRNSPYTQALTKAMTKPGLTIEETFKEARRTVLASTGDRQTPWETSSITGRFYFKKAAPKPQISKEELTWSLVKNSTNPDLIQTYVNSYPQGKYAGEARAAIARLTAEGERIRAEKEARRRAEAVERKARLEAAAKAEADRLAKLEAERRARQRDEAERRKQQAQELADWQAVRGSKDPAELRDYLARYPASTFADLAKARLSALTTQRLAARQPAPVEAPAPETAQDSKLDTRELTLSIQRHLQRLGCNPGRPDGAWGRNSRAALQRFAKHARAQLASLNPSQAILDSLKTRKGRACPVVCGPRQVLKGTTCVAKRCPAGTKLDRRGKCSTTTQNKQQKTKQKKSTAGPTGTFRQKQLRCAVHRRATACLAAGCKWSPRRLTACQYRHGFN